ncbi:MAG TPA: DUF222 domain-containing protein [Microbacteriaceae bacterium]|nr:DUF222 domain-containing protein [Microbacteriaceae bacterium]
MDTSPLTAPEQAHRADLAAYTLALDELVDVQAEIDRLQARRARVLMQVQAVGLRVHGAAASDDAPAGRPSGKAVEFAHRSLRMEVGMSLRLSEYAAANLLSEAELLVRDLPETLGAADDGRLTYRAAAVIAAQAVSVEADRRAEFDVAALRIARDVAPSRLRSRLSALRDRLAPMPAAERHASARAERRVGVEDVDDGMSWLTAYLPSVEAHAIDHHLTALARRSAELDEEDGVVDGRTRSQRRADLLVALIAADSLAPGELDAATAEYERRFARARDLGRFSGIRPTVVVTVPVQALLEPGSVTEPAMLDGVVPIDPVTARELTANAPGLYRMLTDPHTGVALDLGRERYRLSTELRLWLRLRDGTCRAPGCGRAARGCDVDHTVDWQYGGRTRPDNLAHLCRGHHTLKHQTRWSIRQLPDGTIEWRSPTGREYRTRPAGALAPAAAPTLIR